MNVIEGLATSRQPNLPWPKMKVLQVLHCLTGKEAVNIVQSYLAANIDHLAVRIVLRFFELAESLVTFLVHLNAIAEVDQRRVCVLIAIVWASQF
jgi:hypothetical protein